MADPLNRKILHALLHAHLKMSHHSCATIEMSYQKGFAKTYHALKNHTINFFNLIEEIFIDIAEFGFGLNSLPNFQQIGIAFTIKRGSFWKYGVDLNFLHIWSAKYGEEMWAKSWLCQVKNKRTVQTYWCLSIAMSFYIDFAFKSYWKEFLATEDSFWQGDNFGNTFEWLHNEGGGYFLVGVKEYSVNLYFVFHVWFLWLYSDFDSIQKCRRDFLVGISRPLKGYHAPQQGNMGRQTLDSKEV